MGVTRSQTSKITLINNTYYLIIQIKMLEENSAEFACGQLLYNIKMSKLNYMVKETPYSAYITVRKKFVKGVVDIKKVEPDETKKMLD